MCAASADTHTHMSAIDVLCNARLHYTTTKYVYHLKGREPYVVSLHALIRSSTLSSFPLYIILLLTVNTRAVHVYLKRIDVSGFGWSGWKYIHCGLHILITKLLACLLGSDN